MNWNNNYVKTVWLYFGQCYLKRSLKNFYKNVTDLNNTTLQNWNLKEFEKNIRLSWCQKYHESWWMFSNIPFQYLLQWNFGKEVNQVGTFLKIFMSYVWNKFWMMVWKAFKIQRKFIKCGHVSTLFWKIWHENLFGCIWRV